MADKRSRTDKATPLLTKQDLLDCFGTDGFARHVMGAVNPVLDKMVTAINSMKSAIQYHEADIIKIRGAVSKHKQQLKSQAEQIKELQTKKENEDKREQQKRLIITGLNEEEPKKHFIATVKEKLNIDITETDFSLETKEIRILPRQNENARQSTSGSTGNEATNIMEQRKKIVTLNFASTWKKREIYAARVARHRHLPLRRYRCQSTCFIF